MVVSIEVGYGPDQLMKTLLICPCGEVIQGKDEDDLVERANRHLQDEHPRLAGTYTREQILFMAT